MAATKPATRKRAPPRTRDAAVKRGSVRKREPQPAGASEDIFDLIGKSENIEQAAVAMQAMAHPARIKILCLLSSGEQRVQDITDAIGTSQSNISQHLAILKACGMIVSRREATRTYYSIEDPRIVRMIALTRDIFCAI